VTTPHPAPRGHAAELRGRRAECAVLDQLIEAVRAGASRALVVRGEPGVGKTALLDYLAGRAHGCRVARAVGVQSEMELAFAALHQLCAPMLDRLERLPDPQRAALRTAFGISAGPAPDRFLIGLGVLSLLADAAARRPLVCLVDDEQWLDRASAQVLAFVARRLEAESVGLVFAARTAADELAGLPELVVTGLRDGDARVLLDSVFTGPLDARVRDQIVAETRGNPLALLELPRGLTPAELAGGFGLPGALPSAARLSGRLEETFRRQLDALPPEARRLVQLAASDPVGDPVLVWRAAERLGIGAGAQTPAAEAGLVEFGAQVRFRHPLVRSMAYRSASLADRQEAHRALAEVTDPQADPDRRAWHRARAAPGPDDDVAEELERSAGRAQARGGMAAAAAFLERAALLTREPARRAQRLLAAARAQRAGGALDDALGLLVAVEAGPEDALRAAETEHLRGQIALDQRRGPDAVRLLLSAARRFEPLNPALARETHLEALWEAAMWTGHPGDSAGDQTGGQAGHPDPADGVIREAAAAASAAPPGPDPPRAVDVLLDALALRFTRGYAAAVPALTRALELVLALDVEGGEAGRWLLPSGGRISQIIALELWDFDSWHALAARQARLARDAGALVHLQFALNYLARASLLAGDLAAAGQMIEEEHLIAEATRNPPVSNTEVMLAAWRGQEPAASELIEATVREATVREATVREATAGGLSRMGGFTAYASSVLHNGLGQYETARAAAWRAFESGQLGHGPLVVSELAEAAARTGDVAAVKTALHWLSGPTRVLSSDWALGTEARIRALLSEGQDADGCYRESIARLGRTRLRAQLARGHLLYGEWLRREQRRVDAREQLRIAQEMFGEMGMAAFASRARRELLSTGETVRKRTGEPVRTRAGEPARARAGPATEALTAQEAQIARLARDGLSNPEIGTRLFISSRTVQYHLRNVFTKLGISSRNQLYRVLPADLAADLAQADP
jgi:DNA-binding CsgD family transcriptional regulator